MSIDKICLWYVPVNEGTTGEHVDDGHNLYKCKKCIDPYNRKELCDGYRSEKFYNDKKKNLNSKETNI